jgi:hypothetical protein
MRITIEARIEDGAGGSEPIPLVDLARADGELKQLELSLAAGKSLVYEAQRSGQCTSARFRGRFQDLPAVWRSVVEKGKTYDPISKGLWQDDN